MKVNLNTQPVNNLTKQGAPSLEESGGAGFGDVLKGAVSKVNSDLLNAQSVSEQVAAGEPVDVAQAMLALSKADLSFKLLLQVRNRALGAYEEIMRMQF